jgi:protein phosphatase
LTLAVDTGRNPIAPPLEELDALHLGVGLARLLVALHREGFTLGEVTPADVEMTAAELPRLRNAANLARGTDVAEDLRGFASLMEAVTATPRTTQRLGEDEVAELTADPGIPGILRALRTGEIVDAAALLTQLENLLADRTQPLPLWANVGAFSNVGMVRDHNEDSLLTLDLRTDQNGIGRAWGLFIVADGMGGHSAGEVASGLAIRGASESVLRSYLTPTLEMDQGYDEQRLKDVVAKAIVQANEYVLREAQARGNDMGTTITMAVTVGDRAVIGNVGDSRTYLYRDGEMRRVSKDHSLVMRLVDLGQIGLDDIYTHPQRNAVLRSLGDKPGVEIDVFVERLKPGDALFLCSDGMWEMVRDPQMAKIIDANPDPQTACVELVKAANAAGGEDNIAAVLVKFEKYG